MSNEKMVKAFVLKKISAEHCETTEYDFINYYPILGVYSTKKMALQKARTVDFGKDYAEVYEEYVPESAVEKETVTAYQVIAETDLRHIFREYDNRKDADNCVDILIASTTEIPEYGPDEDIRFFVREVEREI